MLAQYREDPPLDLFNRADELNHDALVLALSEPTTLLKTLFTASDQRLKKVFTSFARVARIDQPVAFLAALLRVCASLCPCVHRRPGRTPRPAVRGLRRPRRGGHPRRLRDAAPLPSHAPAPRLPTAPSTPHPCLISHSPPTLSSPLSPEHTTPPRLLECPAAVTAFTPSPNDTDEPRGRLTAGSPPTHTRTPRR